MNLFDLKSLEYFVSSLSEDEFKPNLISFMILDKFILWGPSAPVTVEDTTMKKHGAHNEGNFDRFALQCKPSRAYCSRPDKRFLRRRFETL